MTATTSPHTELATDEAYASEAPVARISLLQRFENFWRSVAIADQESAVERFINERGGRLTDDLEREISRRFGYMAGDR